MTRRACPGKRSHRSEGLHCYAPSMHPWAKSPCYSSLTQFRMDRYWQTAAEKKGVNPIKVRRHSESMTCIQLHAAVLANG